MAASNHRAADNESAERPGDMTRERTQTLPTAAVEAVVYMGYPSDLVLSTYHRLLSTRATESQHANHHPPTSGATASTRNIPSRDVSAATLLAAVDDAIRHSSGGSSDTRISSGLATTSSESSSGSGALQGLSVGEGMPPEHADVQQDGSEDDMSSTSRQHSPGHEQESLSHTAAVNSSRPFTDSQTPVSASQSSIIGNDQPSNAERAVSLMETSSISASTGAEGSETAEGSGSNSTTSASPTNAAAASSGPHASSASMAETSAVTTEPRQVTPPSTSRPESTTASRDRSSERAGAGKAAPATEEEARERRRQLQARLRALRAENRRLKARQTCVHCRQKPVALTLLPCGHFILCEECGPSFEACPLCRKTIMADVKTYVS